MGHSFEPNPRAPGSCGVCGKKEGLHDDAPKAAVCDTLIVPDIHEDFPTLESKIVPLMVQARKVIFLGDWFDTFSKMKYQLDMCRFIKSVAHNEDMTVLLGNHDCHYFFSHQWFQCTGWHAHTKMIVSTQLEESDIRAFKIFTQVGKFVISHAGFHPATLQHFHPTVEKEALESARDGEFHKIFGVGKVRGGWEPAGGPTWLDWNQEFVALGTPQIVGHTRGEKVRTKECEGVTSYCLDTGLKHVMWTDGEAVEVVTL